MDLTVDEAANMASTKVRRFVGTASNSSMVPRFFSLLITDSGMMAAVKEANATRNFIDCA